MLDNPFVNCYEISIIESMLSLHICKILKLLILVETTKPAFFLCCWGYSCCLDEVDFSLINILSVKILNRLSWSQKYSLQQNVMTLVNFSEIIIHQNPTLTNRLGRVFNVFYRLNVRLLMYFLYHFFF